MKKSEESKTDYSHGLEFPDPAEQTDYSNNVLFEAQDDESSSFIPSDKIGLRAHSKTSTDIGGSQSPSLLTMSTEEIALLEDIINEQEQRKSKAEESFADIKKQIDELVIAPTQQKYRDSLEDIQQHIVDMGGEEVILEHLNSLRPSKKQAYDPIRDSIPAQSDEDSPIASFSDEEKVPVRVRPEHKSKPKEALKEEGQIKRREAPPKSQSDFITHKKPEGGSDDLRKTKSDEKHHGLFGHISPHFKRKKTNDQTLSSSPPKGGPTGSRPTSPAQQRKHSKPEEMEGSSQKYSKHRTSRQEDLEKEPHKDGRRKRSNPESPEVSSSPPKAWHTNNRPNSPTPPYQDPKTEEKEKSPQRERRRKGSKPKSLERKSRGSQPDSPEISSSPPKSGYTNSRPNSPTQSPKEVRRKASDPIALEDQHSPTSGRKIRRAASKMRLLGDSISGSPENCSDSSDDIGAAIEDIRTYARQVSSYQLTRDPLGQHIKKGDIDEVLKFRLANEPEPTTTTLIYKAISAEAHMEDAMVRRLLHCYGNQFTPVQVYDMLGNSNAEKECGKVYELLQHGALGIPILIGGSVIKYGERLKWHHRARHEIHKDDLANDHHTIAAQYIAAFNLMYKSSISEIAMRIQNRDFKLPGQKKNIVHGESNQNAVIYIMRQQFSEVNGILYLIANHIASVQNKKTWDIMSKLCSANLEGVIQATTFERYYQDKFKEAVGGFASSKMRNDGMERMFSQLDNAKREIAKQ